MKHVGRPRCALARALTPRAWEDACRHLSTLRPISLNCHELKRAGRVKGGAAAERSEGTLDAPEHFNRLTKGNGGAPIFVQQQAASSIHRRNLAADSLTHFERRLSF